MTIGYSIDKNNLGSGSPRYYFLLPGIDADVGFLKLFVSTRPLDMRHIPQPSPFKCGEPAILLPLMTKEAEYGSHVDHVPPRIDTTPLGSQTSSESSSELLVTGSSSSARKDKPVSMMGDKPNLPPSPELWATTVVPVIQLRKQVRRWD